MRTLQLVFLNNAGGRVTISIPEPLEPIDPAAVEEAMDELLAADVITSNGGGLVAKVRAQTVLREVEPVLEF
ncbi:MAG: DUF2922 domain-containing protein [Firmicutes bacterium]|nr:DUF2922 domain-containing protein [Bacillota bacterium]